MTGVQKLVSRAAVSVGAASSYLSKQANRVSLASSVSVKAPCLKSYSTSPVEVRANRNEICVADLLRHNFNIGTMEPLEKVFSLIDHNSSSPDYSSSTSSSSDQPTLQPSHPHPPSTIDSIVQYAVRLEKDIILNSGDRGLDRKIHFLTRRLHDFRGLVPVALFGTLMRCILAVRFHVAAWDLMLDLFMNMEQHDIEVTECVLATLFTGLSEKQLYNLITIVMQHKPFLLSTKLYNAVILKCQEFPKNKDALGFTTQLVIAMGAHGVQPNFGTYSNLMSVMATKQKVKAFYQVFQEWRNSETHLSHIGYSDLIGHLAMFHDFGNGFAVWEELCAVHAPFPLTHSLLHGLISLSMDSKDLSKAHEILSYFRGQNMELDIPIYNLLLHLATELKCYALFRAVLATLRGQPIPIEEESFVVSEDTLTQQWSTIIFQDNKEVLVPNEETFKKLFLGFATFTFQESEDPVALYNQLLERDDFQFDVSTFEAAIQMFGAWKRPAHQILQLFVDILSRGCSPRAETFARLISALIQIGNRDAFDYTVKELLPKHIHDADQHKELCNIIFHGCVILHNYELGTRVATTCHMPLPPQLCRV